MKFTIERSALLGSLAHVQSIVERRNTIQILSNVQLVASEAGLSLTATDMDIAIVETVPCQVEQTGGTTAPAHTMYDIVRKLPEGSQIEFSYGAEDGRLSLRSGRSEFALSCLPQEDFPVMAEDDLPHRFTVGCAGLARLIEKSRFAVSTEETRYYLNGIFIHPAGDGNQVLRAVATDGHRLARVEIPLPPGAEGMPGIIVPRKTVSELFKLVEGSDGDVEVALSESKARFSTGAVVLTTKLIDGTFPDYERVIPSGNDKVLEVDNVAFAKAVDRVSTISSEKSRAVKLALDKDRMVISANSPEHGSATEEVPVTFDGGDIEIGFNSRYVLDITDQIDGDIAKFILADAGSPTIITELSDDSALYVLMPMRV